MRIDEAPILRHCSDAVRVSVGCEPGVTLLLRDRRAQQLDVRFDWLGVNARKKRIHLLPDGYVVDSMVGENARHHAAPRAVHGIDCELEIRFRDEIQIRELAHRLDVCLLEIDLLDGCRLCSRRSAVR